MRRTHRQHRPAVPIVLGQQAVEVACQAGLDASRLTIWTRPQCPGLARASFRRNGPRRAPTPTLVIAEHVAHSPDRGWVLAHEVAHLVLGHGHPRSRPRSWVPEGLLMLAPPAFVLLSVLLPQPLPIHLASMLALTGALLGFYRQRQREYAADAYATTSLHTPMTSSAMRTLRASEPQSTRQRALRFARTHPLPEDRFACSERLRISADGEHDPKVRGTHKP